MDVLLPFHRDDLFLRIAVNSILASEGVLVRLLLIDDRPLDVAITSRSIPDLDSYIVSRTGGGGYAAALNSARECLESEFVSLMNSDDWSSPDRLANQISALKESESNFSICSLVKFKNYRIHPPLLGHFKCRNYNSAVLLLGAYGANATWLADRETWARNVYFEDSAVSDWLTAMKILPQLKVIHVNENLYWYRQHSAQITNSKIQQKDTYKDLVEEASKIAKILGLYDEKFEMNFRITALPYSLSIKPSKYLLLNAWRYITALENLNITDIENLILRRKLLIAVKMLKKGYFDLDTLKSIFIGGFDLVKSYLFSISQRPPKLLRDADVLMGLK